MKYILANIVKRKDFIPWLKGRPKRDIPINKDDIVNLKIVLYTTKGVEEFVNGISDR